MPVRLTIRLKKDPAERMNYSCSSLFQGAMMEQIDPVYGQVLHEQGLKPYTMNLQFSENEIFWNVIALSETAEVNIIDVLLKDNFQEVLIKKKNLVFPIIDKKVYRNSYSELFEQNYLKNRSRYIKIRFMTPTAFKSNKQYQNYPTPKWIFQSLMLRYDAYADDSVIYSEELLDHYSTHIQTAAYNLRSVSFALEGIWIPAFLGEVTYKINGNQSAVNLAYVLLRFGEYAGVGIKTALGMGRIDVSEGKNG